MNDRFPNRGARVGAEGTLTPRAGVHRRLFELPPEQISAAENWFTFGARTPRAARRASSVCLVREGAAGVETYLSYRPGASPLGTVAFPGGSIEAEDTAHITWFGPSPTRWSEKLGVLDQKVVQAHLVCAVRELFEETGILLAGADEQSVVETGDPEEWMSAREAIAGKDLDFSQFLQRRGLGIRTDLLRPVAHWLSPNFALRRFDTWYFTAAVPQRQQPSLLRAKGRWAQWCSAGQVIARRESTWLGDRVGQSETIALNLNQISNPAVEIILENMAQSQGTIAYLTRVHTLDVQHANLLVREGRYLLEVVPPETWAGPGGSS